jgi:AbrB family looped-hinge helix DNA binding protein
MTGIATVGNKGQFVIPAEVRSALGIEPGARICASLKDARIVLEVVSEALVDRTRGMFKGGPSLSAALKPQSRNGNR